jgi:thiol:disulfide interchange protein DsbG
MRHVIQRLHLTVALLIIAAVYSADTTAADNGRAAAMERLAASMLHDIDHTTWISEGKSKHIIYIFFDPNCPFCHRLYVNTRTWVKEGKAELRWIPVGILTTTSAGKAAAILGAKDPRKAFYDNEDHYDRGGAIEEDIPSPAVEKKLKANAALLARTGFGAVPVMLFRGNDNTPILIQGSPPPQKLDVILKYVK